MLDFCPNASFIVIFPFLFTIFISPPFGPLWQNTSALFPCSSLHPYMDEHCFSVSKGHPLTEKWRGHGLLSCDSPLAGMAVLCTTPHLITPGKQPQINLSCLYWRGGSTGKPKYAISNPHQESVPCLCLQGKPSIEIFFPI